MFIWINRSLGLLYIEQVAVRKVGESDTLRFKLFGLLWRFVSYKHVDGVEESGPFLSLLFKRIELYIQVNSPKTPV